MIITGLTNANGYYTDNGFTCAAYKNGNKIIISFRGTDPEVFDYLEDIVIIRNFIPATYFHKAENFYNQIIEYYNAIGEDVEIEFTGHSIGGAIAQLMGAKYGNKTVTFNAPGMLNLLEQIDCSTTATYNNITNYSVLNDYVGNFQAHVGYTYYIPPIPINDDPKIDTHNGIFSYSEETHGNIIAKIPGFSTEHAFALWYYDRNNYLATDSLKNVIPVEFDEKDLENAVLLVEEYIGSTQNLTQQLNYLAGNKSYSIGSKYDDLLLGQEVVDKLWGNEGNDTLYGYGGNDTIYSVQGDDVLIGGKGNDDLRGSQGFDTYIFYTGDGNDVIKETNQYRPSVKGISYYLRCGQIQVEGAILTGGTWDETTQTYVGYQSGITYSWSGVDNTQMIINYGNGDTIKIANFDNGDLGLFFDREIITDKDDIPDRLTRMKQVYADLQANNICNAYN